MGGTRSGKSRQALLEGEAVLARVGPDARGLFVATARALDAEMAERIARHRAERGPAWETLEEPLDLAGALADADGRYGVILVDCLTLWLANRLARDPAGAAAAVDELAGAAARLATPAVFVSNEVGWGLVPPDPASRRFRDMAGRLHQALAAVCPRVILVVAGRRLDLPAGP
ncbi:bifunctional adenosylcobinamide kinase/adenosylcobinamide-phosphate guanylyltransferase [Dissulfurirhabdus thermomarina]|uniref:Adenosylcobinamide kinase n=1 Tax=Dissulfurirhabdus thermomarina TaxID=1765737 RepID=A0A6N9TQG9_DISTH|nr:bifunctional adenosylcobinamide kinase/adenosylcobinamide-phosphate guanylyltransferase [Dissulfurirhabdus thermomarina]NDY42353.1 bifunctional adenosylcobinamide kinase/adenosylcobinamide-phosphate guanylyltransferase [Dissulfurirhabdus thermomarina]